MSVLNEMRIKDIIRMIENRNAYIKEIARFELMLKICKAEFKERLTVDIEYNKAWLHATERNIVATCRLIAEG